MGEVIFGALENTSTNCTTLHTDQKIKILLLSV